MTSEREIAKYFLDVPRDNTHHLARIGIARAMRAVAPQARGDLVDIGCGLRPYQSLFAPHIERYIGIDYPPTGGDRTQINATIYADSTHLPLRDRCADTVLTTQVLEHVPEPLLMLREVRRVLRPGGKLIMTAPFVWGEHETPRDFYRYTSYGLQYLLGRASFRALDVRSLDGLYAVLGQMYLDELNLTYHARSRRGRRIIRATNSLVNRACVFLDRRYPSARLCLTYLVVAECAAEDTP